MISTRERTEQAERYLEQAMASHGSGQLKEARDCYLRVIEILPDHADALHFLGMALYQLGEVENAERYIRGAIRLRPDQCDYHSNLGLVLKSSGQYREAIECFSLALTLSPDFPDCQCNLGSAYLALGQLSDAEDVLRNLVEAHPQHAEGCNNLAVLLAKSGQDDEAAELYERALALRPNYVDAHLNLGRLFMRRQDYERATQYFQTAVDLDGSDSACQRELGDALQKTGQLKAAMAACSKALALAPNDARCHVGIGNVYQSEGRFEEAEKCYRRALEIDPANSKAINNLGTVFMQDGDVIRALECFVSALEQDPDFVEAVFNKGSALQKMGRIDDAARQYRRAIELRPTIPRAHRYLSEIYRVTGKQQEQIDILRLWLKYRPDSATATHLLLAAEQSVVPERASDQFIREEFDDFADTFDETLAALDYKTPQLLEALMQRELPPDTTSLSVLDAGCGTGLCGPLLRPFSGWLAGVDLSRKMIAEADKREVYDELITAELGEFLNNSRARYDLIVSADTMVYFGALENVARAAKSALRPGGMLAFSVERLDDGSSAGFRLDPSGRYSHRENYIADCLNSAGFIIRALERVVLRMESEKPVDGLIVLGQLA